MAKTVAFSRPLGKTLQEMARQHRGYVASTDTPQPRTNSAFVAIAKTPSGGIPAMTGTTPGSAACVIYYIDANEDLVISSPEQEETVYNIGLSAVNGDSYVAIHREVFSGKLVVAGSTLNYKSLIRFTLTAALATSDASKSGTIQSQYGPGIASPSTGAGAITLHNLLTATASTYLFEGLSGAAGLAIWDSGTNYRIIQMECPA